MNTPVAKPKGYVQYGTIASSSSPSSCNRSSSGMVKINRDISTVKILLEFGGKIVEGVGEDIKVPVYEN